MALASLSRAEHGGTYERGRELSLHRITDSVMLRSVLNSVVASGAAYCFGWLMRTF
jgi:hypothetical protein